MVPELIVLDGVELFDLLTQSLLYPELIQSLADYFQFLRLSIILDAPQLFQVPLVLDLQLIHQVSPLIG